jgi:predicted Zn-dependent protease with MMP-like domain
VRSTPFFRAAAAPSGGAPIIAAWHRSPAAGPRPMNRMSLRRFGGIVRRVLESLPEEITRHLDNVVVDVEDEPDPRTLREMGFTPDEIGDGESLYGLFVPMQTMPDEGDFMDQPHRILIYKNPLEDDFPDPRALRIEIRKTVVHELAHHFGWTDRDLERFDNTDDPFGDADEDDHDA